MPDQWHYRMRGREYGPVTLQRLKELVELGIVEPDSDVKTMRMPDWVPAESVLELAVVPKPSLEQEPVIDVESEPSIATKPSASREPSLRECWHYIKNGKRHGPVTFEDLRRLVATGDLKEIDQLWQQGSATDSPDPWRSWTAARNVPGLFSKSLVMPILESELPIQSVPSATESLDPSIKVDEGKPDEDGGDGQMPMKLMDGVEDKMSISACSTASMPPEPSITKEIAEKAKDQKDSEGHSDEFDAFFLEEMEERLAKKRGRSRTDHKRPGVIPMQDGHKPSTLKSCPDCGHMVSMRAASCPKCGAPVESQISCSDCGTLFPAKALTCPSCGAPNEGPPSTSSQPKESVASESHAGHGVAPSTHGTSSGSWEAVAFACWIAGVGLVMTVLSAFLAGVSQSGTFGVVTLLSTVVMLVGGSISASFVPTETRLRTLAFFNLAFAILGSIFSTILFFSHHNDFEVLLVILAGSLLTLWPIGFILFLGAIAAYFRNDQLAASSKQLLLTLMGVGVFVVGLDLIHLRGHSSQTRATLSTAEIVYMFINGGWGLLVVIWLAVMLWRTERLIRKESVAIMERGLGDSHFAPLWSLLSQPDFGWTSPSGKSKVLAVLIVAWAVVSCFAIGKVLFNSTALT